MQRKHGCGWALIKMLACGVVAGCLALLNAVAQTLKPSDVIDLAHVKIVGSDCKASRPDGFYEVEWLDDSRLLASTYWVRCKDVAMNPKKFETEAILFDVKGTIFATAHGHASWYARGPHGSIAALQDDEIELLDGQMHIAQTIPCPDSSKRCGISLDQSSAAGVSFALCSSSNQSHQLCDFYAGWPATKSHQQTLPIRVDPFTRVAMNSWQVLPKENWLFRSGHLTRVELDGSSSLVNPTDFVGNNGGSCGGQLSEALPRRFLATCIGTHWYSDGMFDNIFGFSHVLLFDVTTKSILGRVDGSAFIKSALSPLGTKIAILKGDKVRIYDVP